MAGSIAKRLDRFGSGNAIEMMRGDQALKSVADRLERLVSGAQASGGAPRATAPSGPQLERPMSRKRRGGLNPWLVVGAALAGGYLAAKLIDWRSHAHPR